jgi:spectinomycin phosphotransferase
LPQPGGWIVVLLASTVVRSPPDDIRVTDLHEELVRGWGFRPSTMAYVPEGGGSHHWRAFDGHDGRLFVTVDDLEDKHWLGDTRDQVFDGLGVALSTAEALRRADLDFVVAPIPTEDGSVVRRLNDRYSVSVFPYLEGHSFPFGQYPATLGSEVSEMLAALHRATAEVRNLAPYHRLDYGDSRDLHAFLDEPDRPWVGGPLSEPARLLLARKASAVVELVHRFELLVAGTVPASDELVITHGEPHPANVVSVAGRLLLVDWDTAALAPPERDLALVIGPDLVDSRYRESTGHAVNADALSLYQLRWFLDDLASAVRLFRRRHETNPDTLFWWNELQSHIDRLPEWQARLG